MTFIPAFRSYIDRRLRGARAIATTPAHAIPLGKGSAVGRTRTLMARFGRRLIVAGAVLAAVLSISATPAAAVTTMNVALNIETYPGISVDNNKYALNIDIHLPSNRWDGQGYINNGAVIKLWVMGSDTFFDDTLMGPLTFSKSNGLFAQDDGIHLRLHYPATYDQLDEDFGGEDEIYIKATWVDGDGATIKSRSNEVSGIF